MIQFTDITGLTGMALACAVVLSSLLGRVARGVAIAPALMLGGAFLLMLVPVAGLPLAAYVRGMIGDLSVTSVVLLAYVAARRCGGPAGPANDESRNALAWGLVLLTACLLYPLALGASALDPYRWGYGDPGFMTGLLTLAVVGHLARIPFVAVAISLAVLAWTVGWTESTNLWDYLIAPMLSIVAASRVLAAMVSGLRQRMT